MKNFTLWTLIITSIVCLSSQVMHASQQQSKQSIMAYLYSCLKPQTQIIPSARAASKKVIIFDLDGVLCKTNDLQAFYEIGMQTIVRYMLKHGQPCQQKLFKALQHAPALTTHDAYNNGMRLPNIMIDWQCNAQALRDIQDCMVAHICSNTALSIEEKNLHINTVLMMTTPHKFITTRQLILAGLQLAQKLKDLGYKLYILSNWDATSFPLFQEQFPELFMHQGQNLFDGIMISGKAGLVKPDPNIFKKFLQRYNINPADAMFIDDTIENIQTAEMLGITSIQCKNNNIADVIAQLAEKLIP